MKKEIRLMLDYQSYPVWIYDENGNFIDNDLVDEIKKNENMVLMLDELQDKYDSLYLNNKDEFKYIGFPLDEDKQEFGRKVNQVYRTLCNLLDGKYIIKNMIDIHSM